jgi:uncharacterized protein
VITRRGALKVLAGAVAGGLSFGAYAMGVEPLLRLRVQRYAITPPQWPKELALKIAVIADLHACNPWMGIERVRGIAALTNDLKPDVTVLLGDYAAGHHWVTGGVLSADWSAALSGLTAPLGVHAILGNHDWWDDRTAQRNGSGPVIGRLALEKVGIPVYENDVVRLTKDGRPFWLAGLGDQLALLPGHGYGRKRWQGKDDLTGTLAKVRDDAPIILMAHEPDIFPKVPDRVALTLSGHTHGGQVRILNYSPVVPSRYKNRYAYGHVVETDAAAGPLPRHLIVSGGLGCSIAPIRFGVPPEVVLIELGSPSRGSSA